MIFNPAFFFLKENYIDLLVKCLRVNNPQFQLVAISAIYSLIYEYQKAKVVFKNTNLIQYLIDLNESNDASYSSMRGSQANNNYNKSQTIVEKIKIVLCQLMKLMSD